LIDERWESVHSCCLQHDLSTVLLRKMKAVFDDVLCPLFTPESLPSAFEGIKDKSDRGVRPQTERLYCTVRQIGYARVSSGGHWRCSWGWTDIRHGAIELARPDDDCLAISATLTFLQSTRPGNHVSTGYAMVHAFFEQQLSRGTTNSEVLKMSC
jgi:hypothetical protein